MNRERLKELRENLGLTQKQLGKLLNVSASTICGYERGSKTPSDLMIKNLCIVLNTTPNYLFGFDIVTSNDKNIFISNEDFEILMELKKYNLLYKQISCNPKKWINKINDKFN